MAEIFLAYSREDAPIAARLKTMLQADGYTVFLDPEALVSGKGFSPSTTTLLAAVTVVIVLLSQHATQRRTWVEEELRLALAQEHRVLPVLLDHEAKDNWVWPLIADRQAISVASPADLDKVAREIRRAVIRPIVSVVMPGEITETATLGRWDCDAVADTGEIFFGENEAATGIALTEHIVLRLNLHTKRAVSLLFLHFSLLTTPTAYGPRSYPVTTLAELPDVVRTVVLQVVTSMPVKQFLHLSLLQTVPTEWGPLTSVDAQRAETAHG